MPRMKRNPQTGVLEEVKDDDVGDEPPTPWSWQIMERELVRGPWAYIGAIATRFPGKKGLIHGIELLKAINAGTWPGPQTWERKRRDHENNSRNRVAGW